MKSIRIISILLVFHKLSQAVFVDPQYKLVEWKGWGTSMNYWVNVLADMDQPVQDQIIDLMFSSQKLNLNILRYNIGGTTPGDESCGPFNIGSSSESFQDGIDRPYDWTRDHRSRKALLAAKVLGADTFEAASRSPPSWITRSGCTQGNPEGAPLHDNFDPKFANAFANYLTEVVKYYHEVHNISFSYLSPFFEPSSGLWVGEGMGREGCCMEHSTIAAVIDSIETSLQTKELTFCAVAAASEVGVEQEFITQKYLHEAEISQFYKKIDLLWYSASKPIVASELFSLASKDNHEIWIDSK